MPALRLAVQLEPDAKRHAERAREREAVGAERGAKRRALDEAGRQPEVVERAVRIRLHRRAEARRAGAERLVVEQVDDVRLQPGPYRLEDRNVIPERQIHLARALEGLRAARPEIDRLRAGRARVAVRFEDGVLHVAERLTG